MVYKHRHKRIVRSRSWRREPLAALGSDERPVEGAERLVDRVNNWLSSKQILGRLHVETDTTASVRMLVFGDEVGGVSDLNVAAMGEGVSQMLPIVAKSLTPEPSGYQGCLLIEQPEIHLHPALQADLADLFIDASRSRQVIIETDSEHLVLRIRRRIAEKKIDPERVAILFVKKNGTESSVQRLDLDKKGHFSNWPDGFFDEAYQEAMAMAEASMTGDHHDAKATSDR